MTQKLKNLYLNQKVLITNFTSLLFLQGSNYIIPLILLPYLVHILGIEKFGLLSFATATISFFRAVVSYGFDLTGTKQIALNQTNPKKLNKIFNSIIFVKIILSILGFFILLMVVSLFDKFNQDMDIFLITYIIIFGDILFPTWFFQGIEKMKFITYLKISYKILFLLLVIIFVKEEDDYLLVPLLDSIGSIIIGFYSIYLVGKKYNIKYTPINSTDILFQFKNGWHVFISNIAVILYTSLNTFLLGIFTNSLLVGYYSIAEKIYMAIRGLLTPFTQALFPLLSKRYKENKLKYYNLVKKISYVYFLILLVFSITTYLFSAEIVNLISGTKNSESTKVLTILSIALLFSIGGLFSSFLIIKQKNYVLSKITIKTMILNIIIIIPSIYYYKLEGIAYTLLITQIFHFILQIKSNSEIFKRENDK